jgi:hypothetical protein
LSMSTQTGVLSGSTRARRPTRPRSCARS